ncbi:LysM peptidoglycan-binding domain-containing protein [Verrucomicrobiaceae bacterium 227]
MKATLLLLAPVALLASCSRFNNQQPAAPAAAPASQYGIPSAEAYNPDAAPYQPVDPINPPYAAATPPAYNPPAAVAPAAPVASGGQHMIQKGDTLWGISRRYSVSVEALQQANGLTGTNIIEGRTLIIPGR